MTPTEAITKISHAIAKGNLNDAERVLEEYVIAFDKWRTFEYPQHAICKDGLYRLCVSGYASMEDPGISFKQLQELFINQSFNQNK